MTSATKTLRVVFRLRSPLCIARRPTAPGQPIETLHYLTGTVVRGGNSNRWLQGQLYDDLPPAEQKTFRELFLNPAVTFRNGVPLPGGSTQATIEVVPHTMWKQKYDETGWVNENGMGVSDYLKTFLCNESVPDGMERFSTSFASREGRRYTSKDLKPPTRLITRTAVDSRRGTARDGFLYTLEALETGQRFRGIISGPEQLLAQLQAVGLRENQALSMGQGRTRGMGEVTIEKVEELAAPDLEQEQAQAVENVKRFTHMVRDCASPLRDEDGNSLNDDTMLLPVVLESDVLLRDNYLLPSSDPQPFATLGRYLPLSATLNTQMVLHRAGVVQSTTWIGGWDAIRGVPRSPQLAVMMGSVWTFRVPSAHLDEAVAWWLRAQQEGVGERRNEGYGRVRLCHPMHLMEGKL